VTTTICGQSRRPWTTPAYSYIRATDKLPSTDAAGSDPDPLCRVKVFNPTGAQTWWIAGYDPETGMAFGVADLYGGEPEAGDLYMPELVAVRGFMGLPLERDLHYRPARMSEILGRAS
jgi:hypothetical protein